MAGISLILQNNPNVTQINCGTSSPRLGGKIDISTFQNLQQFRCNFNDITDLTGYADKNNLITLQFFGNKISGFLPSFDALTGLQSFRCDTNLLSGSVPNLNFNSGLLTFIVGNNRFTGYLPSLSSNQSLINFIGDTNFISGNIPNLTNNNQLQIFNCRDNKLVGYNGGSVSNTLGEFQCQNNLLTSSAIDSILSAFVIANRTANPKTLNLGGATNSAPSYSGGVTTSSPGSNFIRSGTTVTANVTGHGHTNGDIVTINGLTPTALHGTFIVSVNNINQFQYTTISSGIATGAGTAIMRRTTNPSDGYASYQNLALVSRPGGPWNITINQP